MPVVTRMSTLFLRTLREDPADAEVPSHRLLVRAGYIRRTAAGVYSWLPLGKRVLDNVTAVVKAEMDGIGHWGFMKEVAVPLVRPSLGALGLFCFLGTWNQYLWPVLVTKTNDYRTVQSGLKVLAASRLDSPNLVMAGTVIAAVPIFVVLIVFQRQLIRGLTAGAVKG